MEIRSLKHWAPKEVPSNGYFQLVGFGLVFYFCFGSEVYFFGEIQPSPVDGCLVVKFSQEKMSACPSTPPSWLLFQA